MIRRATDRWDFAIGKLVGKGLESRTELRASQSVVQGSLRDPWLGKRRWARLIKATS